MANKAHTSANNGNTTRVYATTALERNAKKGKHLGLTISNEKLTADMKTIVQE